MKITRLSQIAHIHQFWHNFREGFNHVTSKTRKVFDNEEILPELHYLVCRPDQGFIAVCRDEDNNFLGFIIAKDVTEKYQKQRHGELVAVYYSRNGFSLETLLFQTMLFWFHEQKMKTLRFRSGRKSTALNHYFENKFSMVPKEFLYERRF